MWWASRHRPLREVDVLVFERLAVDPVARRRDPARDLPALVHRVHQRADEGEVFTGGQPVLPVGLPCLLVDDRAVRGHAVTAGCASLNGAQMSLSARILFHRLSPFWQSAMYSPRRSRFSASSVWTSS